MKQARKRNLLRAPLVILVSAPIRLPFWVLARIGERADKMLGRLRWLPLFEYED